MGMSKHKFIRAPLLFYPALCGLDHTQAKAFLVVLTLKSCAWWVSNLKRLLMLVRCTYVPVFLFEKMATALPSPLSLSSSRDFKKRPAPMALSDFGGADPFPSCGTPVVSVFIANLIVFLLIKVHRAWLISFCRYFIRLSLQLQIFFFN